MRTVRSTPCQSQFADARTKDNQDISKLSNALLTTGQRSYPDSFYAAVSDIRVPSTSRGIVDKLPPRCKMRQPFWMNTITIARNSWNLSCTVDYHCQFTAFLPSTIPIHVLYSRCLFLAATLTFFQLVSPTLLPQPPSHCPFQYLILSPFNPIGPAMSPSNL